MIAVPPSGRALLTEEGRRLLEERIRALEATAEDLHAAVQDPERTTDTVESYHRAVKDVERLRALLDEAGAVEEGPDDPTVVELGDSVTIRLYDGMEETYIVVHAAEATVEDQRISAESPLGHALLGARVGETVEVEVPTGTYRCEIMHATRRPAGGPAAGDS